MHALLLIPLALLMLLGLAPSPAAAAPWGYAVSADGKRQSWGLLELADKPWRLCALLPHGKDKYWWGVAWGLAEDAKRLKLQLGIYQANSYSDLPLQRRQWADCRAQGAQAYILAAISADGLAEEIAQAQAEGKPVIDLINGISTEATSHAVVSFADMARHAADYLLRDAGGRPVRLMWFPGPDDAVWVQDAERGLLDALSGRKASLVLGGRGPTDMKTQSTLVREQLGGPGPAPDYVLGNAVAIEFAARFLPRQSAAKARTKLVSLYATDEIVDRIRRGEVLAAPTDQPVVQARLALDLAVRALQGQRIPKRISPDILMLDAQALKTVDLQRLLPPPGQGMVQQPLPPLPPIPPVPAPK